MGCNLRNCQFVIGKLIFYRLVIWVKYHLTASYFLLAKCGTRLHICLTSLHSKATPTPYCYVSLSLFRGQSECCCNYIGGENHVIVHAPQSNTKEICPTAAWFSLLLDNPGIGLPFIPQHTSLAIASHLFLFTHVIHYLPFPLSPGNNCPTWLRNPQITSLRFLIFPYLYHEVTRYPLHGRYCTRQWCIKTTIVDWPLYPP